MSIKIVLILIVCANLVSCNISSVVKVDNHRRYSPTVKYDQNQAYVIVGAVGDLPIMQFMGSSNAYTLSDNGLPHNTDVHIFPVKLNSKFTIHEVHYWDPLRSTSRTAVLAKIKNRYVFRTIKPGLYYYGTIYTKAGRMIFSRKTDPFSIKLAKKKFPRLFKTIKKVYY